MDLSYYSKNQKSENYDYLTGLLNRRGLHDIWNSLLPDTFLHCIYIDVDNFKMVNDIYGHSKGDELLIFIANALQKSLQNQLVIRMGGDEFVALCSGGLTCHELENLLSQLSISIQNNDFDENIIVIISLSIGIICNVSPHNSLTEILQQCDEAMYYAKKNGKGHWVYYHEIEKLCQQERILREKAPSALKHHEIHFLLRPIMYLQATDVYAAEIYPTWTPEAGTDSIDKDVFLPILERYGYIKQLDEQLFKQVCMWKQQWHNSSFEHLLICVTLSTKFLLHFSTLTFIKDCLQRYQITPGEIMIAICEKEFNKESRELQKLIASLSSLGLIITINEFGSASSLEVLRNIPSQMLIFHKDMLPCNSSDIKRKHILKNMVRLGIDLHQLIIAQGIESVHQVETLTDYGIPCGSGPLYGAPMVEPAFRTKYEKHLFCIQQTYPSTFSFYHSLWDSRKTYTALYSDTALPYEKGIIENTGSIAFPGGEIGKNLLIIPKDAMAGESYTISLWINPAKSLPWTSALYIAYQDGFMSIIPDNGYGEFIFRIKDDREANEWHDIICRQAFPGRWSHICAVYHAFTGVSKLYFNGIMVGSREKVPTLKLIEKILLGGDDYQASYEGLISELRFYHYPMTAEQIKELFTTYQKQPHFQGTQGKK